MAKGVIVLGEVATHGATMLDIRCGRCDRHGRFSVKRRRFAHPVSYRIVAQLNPAEEDAMPLALNRIGQISLAVRDVEKAEAFYRDTLRLRWLYRFGNLTFFDCSGVRLLLEKATEPAETIHGSPIYFSCADIALAVRELEQRGITFTSKPHLIAPMEDHDLWMAFFQDPDGNTLALMHEAPKGYHPASA